MPLQIKQNGFLIFSAKSIHLSLAERELSISIFSISSKLKHPLCGYPPFSILLILLIHPKFLDFPLFTIFSFDCPLCSFSKSCRRPSGNSAIGNLTIFSDRISLYPEVSLSETASSPQSPYLFANNQIFIARTFTSMPVSTFLHFQYPSLCDIMSQSDGYR